MPAIGAGQAMTPTQAGELAAAASKGAQHSPSWLDRLNPFDVGTIGSDAGTIAHKAGQAAPYLNPLSGKQEELGEDLGHGISKAAGGALSSVGSAIVEGVGALVSTYGIRLLEILAGVGLIAFGLTRVVGEVRS